MKTPAHGRAGFSLIEICMVSAIIALVTVTALPSAVNRMRDYRLDRAVSQLENDLRMARMHAIAVCTRVQIDFDDTRSGYRIWIDRDRDRQEDEQELETLVLPPVAGLHMVSSGLWGRFDPKGNFYSMGLSRGMNVHLEAPRAGSKRITVFPSGEVHVSEHIL